MPVLVDASAAAWEDVLVRTPHDFHARPDVVALEAAWLGCRPAALAAGDALVPLLVRPLPDALGAPEGYDATSPYGYPGVVAATPVAAAEAVRAFQTAGAEAGLVATFLRLHPVLNAGLSAALGHAPGVEVVPSGTTVALDLGESEAAWTASLKQTSRYELRQLEKRGYTVRHDAPTAYASFAALYRETMRRIGAHASYIYDDAYLGGLVAALGERATLVEVLSPEGLTACAGLFVHTGEIVQYHLSGSDERFRKFSPTRLMIAAARHWASARRARLLHLGGGVGGREDSLYAFKRDLGSLVFPYETVRVVHASERYAALTRRRAEAVGAPLRNDFFPAYRQ